MIKLTLEFETFAQLSEALHKINGMASPTHPIAASVALPEIQPEMLDARESKPAEQPKAEAPKDQPAATTSSEKPAESAQPAAAAEAITYEDLKSSIMKLVAAGKVEAMKKICADCGVKTFQGTTDPALWAKAKVMIDAALAG